MNIKSQSVVLTKMVGWWIGQQKMLPTSKDILLFASRRGGSTWLMEVICSNRNVRWIDQPFSLFTGPGGLSHRLPVFECSEAICLEDDVVKDSMRDYVNQLLSGNININSDWRVFSSRFWHRKERTILKIVQAKSIAPWLCDEFPAKPLVLFRHPMAQALSVMRAKWRNHTRAFLNHHWFRTHILGVAIAAECDQIYLQGDPLTRYVLNWALENLILLRMLRDDKCWFSLTYEDCILQPEVVVDSISRHFDLGDSKAMKQRMSVASRTTGLTRDKKYRHSTKQASQWMEKCTKSQRDECQQLLDLLQIDLYSADDPKPRIDLLARSGIPVACDESVSHHPSPSRSK